VKLREFWVSIYRANGGVLDIKDTPSNLRPDPITDEVVHVREILPDTVTISLKEWHALIDQHGSRYPSGNGVVTYIPAMRITDLFDEPVSASRDETRPEPTKEFVSKQGVTK
jgi:hypothetical protein